MFKCPCMKGPPRDENSDEAHLHQPRDYKLYQQDLNPCCVLVLTTQKVVALFIVTGLILLPVGIALLFSSSTIYEQDFDYTDCWAPSGKLCKDIIKEGPEGTECTCDDKYDVDIPESVVNGDIKILYGIKNYYQNHRLYRLSQSFEQLLGHTEVVSACDFPYKDEEVNGVATGKTYYPCGMMANSYFTDTFTLTKKSTGEVLPLISQNISWSGDRDIKFKHAEFNAEKSAWPPLWQQWIDKDPGNTFIPTTVQDERFINWMNPAAFPKFTKLYAKAVMEGKYTLTINYRYKVTDFGGQKFVRFSETSWMGGRSLFLGISYVMCGIACLGAAIFFTIISQQTRKKRHERKELIDRQLAVGHTTV